MEITRRYEFDYGHRVLGHEGKCRHLHGHRGVAEATVSAPELDDLGRVIDFGVLKTVMADFIDANWDHNILLRGDDPLLRQPAYVFEGRMPYIMSVGNPTAENMAEELGRQLKLELSEFVQIVRVRIYETPNCWADFIPKYARKVNTDEERTADRDTDF